MSGSVLEAVATEVEVAAVAVGVGAVTVVALVMLAEYSRQQLRRQIHQNKGFSDAS